MRALSALTQNTFTSKTPTDRPEYVRIKILDIPQEFIEEYNLTPLVQKGWIYFEIFCEFYGLPQSVKLANDLLCPRLEKAG